MLFSRILKDEEPRGGGGGGLKLSRGKNDIFIHHATRGVRKSAAKLCEISYFNRAISRCLFQILNSHWIFERPMPNFVVIPLLTAGLASLGYETSTRAVMTKIKFPICRWSSERLRSLSILHFLLQKTRAMTYSNVGIMTGIQSIFSCGSLLQMPPFFVSIKLGAICKVTRVAYKIVPVTKEMCSHKCVKSTYSCVL